VFTDIAGRTLTYSTETISTGGGTVAIDAATGAFVYTPTQVQRQVATGSTTDTFTVTASNGVRTTTQTVTVTVDPGTPTAGTPTAGTPNTSTGIVTGSAVLTDTAGRTLTYSTPTALSTGGATVSIDAATGAFVYTPTQAQRQAATGSTTDTFTVTASNGVRTTIQTITVTVDTFMAGTPTIEFTNTFDGGVYGSAMFTDTAGRTLTYSTGATSTGGGTVSINAATGAYTYTPTQRQREAATSLGAAFGVVATDTFTVTAGNGVRSITQTITVPIEPTAPVGPITGSGCGSSDCGSQQSTDVWPLPALTFQVQLGTTLVSFKEVSGLDMEAQLIEYRGGDSKVFSTIKMPGIVKYGEVTLKNGVFASDDQFWAWFNQTQMNTIQRANLTISLVDRGGWPVMAWTLTKAWPTTVTGVVSRGNNVVTIEQIRIAHEGITVADA
jgi:phage tail-like protein